MIAGDKIANVIFDMSPGLEVASDEDIDRIFARLRRSVRSPTPPTRPREGRRPAPHPGAQVASGSRG